MGARGVLLCKSIAGFRCLCNKQTERESRPSKDDQTHISEKSHRRGVAGFYTGAIRALEAMRDDGRPQQWAALVISGEEISTAERADWLDFVWLSHQKEQQRRVFEWIRGRSQLS
jgi:hypothetical protein